MQVKILISGVLRLQGAPSSKATPYGRVFLDHDADGVNDFLAQADFAADDHLRAAMRQHGAHM
jgi:hypothetical protein